MLSIGILGWYAFSLSSRASFLPKDTGSSEISQKVVLPQNKTLKLGRVELAVGNLESMKKFYASSLGLEILETGENNIILGNAGTELIQLTQEKDWSQASKQEAGLYHTALVFETQSQLAHTLQNMLGNFPEFYVGSADHSATQAFYFNDPEGNGLELYFDKPRDKWIYENGKPILGSEYLDLQKFLETYLPLAPASEKVHMGHIHLKVGNIEEAEKFYVQILGFEVIENMRTALFVSRDGYHHHLGMNVWESLGAQKRTENTLGLKSFEIQFLDQDAYDTLLKSLKKNEFSYQNEDFGISMADPWGNIIFIKKP